MRLSLLLLLLVSYSTLFSQWTVVYTSPSKTFTQIHFTSSNIGYACGYDGSTGFLLKTIDGGSSWTDVTLPGGMTFVDRMSFLNDTVGYLIKGGAPSRVIKTINGGISWIGHTLDSAFIVGGFAMYNQHEGFYMNNEGRFRSLVADGSDFGYLTDTLLGASIIEFPDSLTGFISMPTGVLKTIDQGLNWNFVAGSFTNEIYGPAFSFTSNTNGFMSTRNFLTNQGAIYRTSDGAATWNMALNFAASHLNTYNNYCLAVDDTGHVAISTNDGLTWMMEDLPATEMWYPPYSCEISPSKTLFIATGSEGKILKRTDPLTQPEWIAPYRFEIFPNPSANELTILTDFIYNRIDITDLNGKIIMHENSATNRIQINQIPNGIYHLNLIQLNGTTLTTTFLKQ